ncbi:MAG: hypothetical protein PHE56_11300 [Bacteroidales bacterium]|nr:hypothetical protein [Bacteroidales bacterium]
MKKIAVICIFIISGTLLFSQNDTIYDILINSGAKKIKYMCIDSIEIYNKICPVEKYLLICSSSIQTSDRTIQSTFRKGTLKYYVYVYTDSLSIIRDCLLNDIYTSFNSSKVNYRGKGILIKENSYLLTIGSSSNNYDDYFIHYYNGRLYKFVFVESRVLMIIKNVGGFSNIDLLFKGKTSYIDFRCKPQYSGLEAYKVLVRQYLNVK